MAAHGHSDGGPTLGVARAGRLQSVFNPLVPTCMDHPHSQAEQVGRLVRLFEREIDTLDGELGGHHTVVKPGFPRWARSPGSCAEKAAEVIAFYQQQICALEARLAERKRARAGGFSSATSAILSSESQTSPDRTPASRLFRCTPGNALPSGSDTSFTTWGAVAAVEWIGQSSVQELRLRFVGEADDSESSEQPEPGWQRKDLFEGEHLCMLRGRHLGWLMWVTSFGRCLTLGGVKILMLNGSEFEVVLDREDTVRDLAVWIRMNMSIPIAVQHLVHESEVLTEPSQQLSKIFPGTAAPVVTVLRRPYTTQERAELFQRLIRSTAACEIAQVRELLKEGAPLDFSPEEQGHDTSVSLDHWDTEEASAAKEELDTKTRTQEDSKDEKDENLEDGEDGSGASEEGDSELQSPPDSDEEMVQEDAVRQVCGGLTPLFMALAIGREDLARDFRQLGAKEMDLSPSSELGAAWTAQPPNVLEIARHIVAGVDPDTMLRRGHS
ncbi:GABRQ [Symbiodinium sp. CCMP2592]|nr:GABRQ [Symbiodinium sp. CCMP2592]